jgi:uncharacterized membrane protein YhaH (DUF805 family)
MSLLLWLGLLSPGVCVGIRRFHDVGLSGWLVLGAFAGVFLGLLISEMQDALGGLVILATLAAALVVTVLPSRPGSNVYGPNPKGA